MAASSRRALKYAVTTIPSSATIAASHGESSTTTRPRNARPSAEAAREDRDGDTHRDLPVGVAQDDDMPARAKAAGPTIRTLAGASSPSENPPKN